MAQCESGNARPVFIYMDYYHHRHARTKGGVMFVFFVWTDLSPSVLFTHLDVYLTRIPDIDPHRVSNDVTILVIEVANQTEGWRHIRCYLQDLSH